MAPDKLASKEIAPIFSYKLLKAELKPVIPQPKQAIFSTTKMLKPITSDTQNGKAFAQSDLKNDFLTSLKNSHFLCKSFSNSQLGPFSSQAVYR